jgi:hypothetical protein
MKSFFFDGYDPSVKKVAILWPYWFKEMNGNWGVTITRIAKALQYYGFDVFRREGLTGEGLEDCPFCDRRIAAADVVVYNHTFSTHLRTSIPSKHSWVMKMTPPSPEYATLDSWGYGPYMSCSYSRPPFDSLNTVEVDDFWTNVVPKVRNLTKWGKRFSDLDIPEKDFIFFPSQCIDDEVVTKMYFGEYRKALINLVHESVWVGEGRDVVVKLHPYTDYRAELQGRKETPITDELEKALKGISKNVHVYRGGYHVGRFLDACHSVVVCNSGVGIDAMMRGKPVISWGYPEYHWATFDLRHACDLDRALKLDWYDPNLARAFLCWFMRDFCFYDQESANRRVGELLQEKLKR